MNKLARPPPPDLPLDFDTIMAHTGLAGSSSNELEAQATPPPDCVDDTTLPELPHSLYGIDFVTDEEDDRAPPAPDLDLSGESLRSFRNRESYANSC